MNLSPLARAMARVCRVVGEAAAAEFEAIANEAGHAADWVDQRGSLLGERRHCATVRRIVAEGGEAAIIGRRYLLSPDALRGELERLTKRGSEKRSDGQSTASELRAQLGLVAGGRR